MFEGFTFIRSVLVAGVVVGHNEEPVLNANPFEENVKAHQYHFELPVVVVVVAGVVLKREEVVVVGVEGVAPKLKRLAPDGEVLQIWKQH